MPPCSRITSGTAREQIRLCRIVRARARGPACRRRGSPWWSSPTGRGRSRRRRTRGRRRRRRRGRRRRPPATTRAWRSRWLAGWIGSAGWFGNVPSSSPYMTSSSNGQALEHLGHDQAAHAVGGVGDDLAAGVSSDGSTNDTTWSANSSSRSTRRSRARGVAAGAGRSPSSTASAIALIVGQAGVGADRAGPGQAQLDAVVLGRVVRGGEHRARRVERPGGEVDEVGRHQAEVDDVDALRRARRRRRRPRARRPEGRMSRPTRMRGAPAKRAKATPMAWAHARRRAGRGRCRGCRRP